MARNLTVVLVLLCLPFAGTAASQEGEEAPAKAAAAKELEAKLRARLVAAFTYAEEAGFVVHGTAFRKQAAGGMGAMGGHVVVSGGAGMTTPFEGNFEAWKDKEETLVLVSEKAVPGFEAYRSLDRTVTRLTYEEQPPSVDELMNDLSALLDMSRLKKWLKKAELDVELDEETGTAVYVGEAPRRLVPSGSGGMVAMIQPKILRVELRIVVSDKAKISEAEFRVVRSDPTAALMRGGMGLGGKGGFGRLPEGEGEDVEGATSTYALEFVKAEPSARAKGFKRTVETLAEDDE